MAAAPRPGTDGTSRTSDLPATFPRRLRLTEARQFSRVFQSSVRSSDALLTVLARPNDVGHPRLGLAIARKTVRRAVDRNRIRRAVRETVRLKQHAMPAVDLVVMARRGAAASPTRDLAASMRRHLSRIERRCAD